MAGEDSKIFKLLKFALTDSSVFLPGGKYSSELAENCHELFQRDYVCTSMDNSRGQLCSTYPVQVIVPVKEKIHGLKENCPNNQNDFDNTELVDLIQKGRFARTRGRFPAPVLFVCGKFICRSSTLARSPEIYGRTGFSGFQYFLHGEAVPPTDMVDNGIQNGNHVQNGLQDSVADYTSNASQNGNSPVMHYSAGKEKVKGRYSAGKQVLNGGNSNKSKLTQSTTDNGQPKEWLVDKMRNTDIDLLHMLKVNVICDFMVEKKKVKYGLNVTSSEKVDREQRYSDFDLISIPYPGCEFFADYTNNNYMGEGLKFDWTQHFVDAELQLPDNMKNIAEVQWDDYMHWDLVKLTQNYIKLLLNCLSRPNSSGILLHCISGWDRTPLFVSLLRLSLWADGLVHQSLTPEEMVYFTLAYDWLLFSHQFADRVDKSEEIMHFCFDFLKYIRSPSFSLLTDAASLQQLGLSDNESSEEVFFLEEMLEQTNVVTKEEVTLNGHSGLPSKTSKNGQTTQNCATKGKPDTQYNGTQNGNMNSQSNLTGEVSLEEVESCLNCIIDEIPERTSKVINTQCEEENENCTERILNSEDLDKSLEVTNSDQLDIRSAPVLPLKSSNITSNTCQSCNGYVESNGETSQDKVYFTEPTTPRSALSTSYETAKSNLFSNNTTSEKNHKGLSNSFSFLLNGSKENGVVKSDPITVPNLSSFVKRNGTNESFGNSCESSESYRTNTAEPGSSWQMIASPPLLSDQRNDSSNFMLDIGPSVQVDRHASRKSSFSSSVYGSTENVNELKAKLACRAERLDRAQNIMIPAYCAVVQQQRRQQEQQSGTFSALFDPCSVG
ncbi:uncharacterized protein LOC100186380 [Ciona intestinalis]